MKTATMYTTYVPWVDRKIGDRFEVHSGSDSWIPGQKIDLDTFLKENGVAIKVSCWTKTRQGRPLIEIL